MTELLDAVEDALHHQRRFNDWDLHPPPKNFDAFLTLLPDLFTRIDKTLWKGALFRAMKASDIEFHIRTATTGPAGLTTFDPHEGMQLFLNSRAWVKAFPAMVGGTLCSASEVCLAKIFAHEMLHVLLFTIYHILGMGHKDIRKLPTSFDMHHNVLFCCWLKAFFDQDTIDNSLLLHMAHADEELTFPRSVQNIEDVCLVDKRAPLRVLYKGKWQEAELLRKDAHHQSLVAVPKLQRKLLVPNGLLRCSVMGN